MMKCIAIDDEPLALKLLEDNISKVPYLELSGTFRNVFDAIQTVQENIVDLMFIDIQMPGLTGTQFVSSLSRRPMVIFITAYKQYALEGFELDVVDYLVKPVALDRFIKACNRAKDLFDLKSGRNQPNNLSANYFFLNADFSQVKIMFDDIIWIEGLRDYVKIHLHSTNKPLVVRISLKALESELPATKFIRIHKSYIVPIAAITAIRKTSLFIKDMELPIGDAFCEIVEKLTKR